MFDYILKLANENIIPEYLNNLLFEKKYVWYPKERKNLKNEFSACASARLFFEDVFTDYDAVVYIDTDMIFMNRPEIMYEQFGNFQPNHVISLAPCLYRYTKKKVKVYSYY